MRLIDFSFLNQINFLLGAFAAVGTPLPIPNREVKHRWADGTAWATVWESKSVPSYYKETLYDSFHAGFFLLDI